MSPKVVKHQPSSASPPRVQLPRDEKELDNLIRLLAGNASAPGRDRLAALGMVARHVEQCRKNNQRFSGRLYATFFKQTADIIKRDRRDAYQAEIAVPEFDNDLLRQVANTLVLSKTTFEARDVPTILHACGTVGIYHEGLFSLLLSQAVQMTPSFRHHEIADIARACSKFRLQPLSLFDAFQKVIRRDLRKLEVMQIGDLALAFGTLGLGDAKFVGELGDRFAGLLQQGKFVGPHALGNMATALAARGLKHHHFFLAIVPLFPAAAEAFFPNDISHLLTACARIEFKNETIGNALITAAGKKKADFRGRTMALTLQAVLDGGWDGEVLLREFGSEIIRRPATFSSKDLAKLAVVYAEFVREYPDVIDAILTAWDSSEGEIRQIDVMRMVDVCKRVGVRHHGLEWPTESFLPHKPPQPREGGGDVIFEDL